MSGRTGLPNPHAPALARVPPGIPRPFWSVMIPTHDCAAYLRRTLASVLAQDPGPDAMQIEVVDDCSTRDDPEAVVRALGGRVAFHRHARNRGATATFNTCLQRARGQWVHLLHGDDLVCPGFYETLGRAARSGPALGAVFCRTSIVDEDDREVELYEAERDGAGQLDGFIERLGVWSRIQAPTIVVRRAVYEALGGFDPRLAHAADWEMWQRVVVHHPVWYEPRPLARYRRRVGSDTSGLMRTGANIADIRRAIDIAQAYLPPAIAPRLRRAALAFYGDTAAWNAKRLRAANDRTAALAQLREAIRCYGRARRGWFALRLCRSALAVWARG